jgi:hypothetical protein
MRIQTAKRAFDCGDVANTGGRPALPNFHIMNLEDRLDVEKVEAHSASQCL